MRSRSGLVLALAFGLPLVLVVSLLVFVAVSEQDCVPNLGAVDVAAEPVPVFSSAPLTARVATWNVLGLNSYARSINGVQTISGSADVIGLQEVSQVARQRALRQVMAGQGWAMSEVNDSGEIVWRASRFKVLAQGSQQVFDVVRIENGASGTSIGPRSIQWVQLQDRQTGAAFSVVNQHIVPSIDRDGRPDTRVPRRIALYDKQIAAELSLVAKLRPYGPVALTGDFNIDARDDQRVRDPRFPYVQLGHVGVASSWSRLDKPSGGTEQHRLIDYVWLTQDSARFVQHRILGKYGSDHSAVVALVTKTGQSGQAPTTSAPTVAAADSVAGSGRPVPASVTVQVSGRAVRLDADQVKIATTVIAEGKALGVPERGWVVALAAAGAESEIRNLDHGDRDSVGPWQMRPSSGWGSIAQIRDVTLATRAFYGKADHTHNRGLTDVPGWEQMSIAQAAQAVEVSAFPNAYTKWEAAARSIVEQLTDVDASAGSSTDPGCAPSTGGGLDGDCPVTDLPSEKVLTPDGLLVLRCVKQQFPSLTTIGTYPGHQPDQTRAVDIMIPGWQSSSGKALGIQIATWVKDHQRELGVQYIIWNGRIWNVKRDSEGWRTYFDADNPDPNRAHRNHVHVSVYGNRGTGPAGTGPAQAGVWHSPVGDPSRVGCGFGCYPGHTGQDYPAPVGTPVYAVNAGTVVRSESITTTGTCAALPICGGTRTSYGNLIVVKLAGSGETTAWYAHLSARRVRVGQTVQAGQVIGAVGYEGHVIPQGPRGAHLHLEIRQGGTPINPLPYLRSRGVQTP